MAHGGESGEGFFLTTLDAVAVATGWTACLIVWGTGHERVGAALHPVRQALPFALRELPTDNGSEFLNGVVDPWCQQEGIRLTRGRPHKKNAQAYVEQKNWSVVRRLIGYDRYRTKEAFRAFERLDRYVRLWVNFFQPVRKLVSQEREGAKVVKRDDTAHTPSQRVLASQILSAERRASLEQAYQHLNPVWLRHRIDQALADLWKRADRGGAVRARTVPDDAASSPMRYPQIHTLHNARQRKKHRKERQGLRRWLLTQTWVTPFVRHHPLRR